MSALREGLADLSARLRSTQEQVTPDPVQDWVQRYFYVYDTEDLLTLHPAQATPLAEAMRKTADGRYVYDTVLWSWMKKSAKSTVIAAVCDYVAMTKPKSSIKLIGNDLKQADSRVGYYMRESILIGARRGYAEDPYGYQEMRTRTRISKSGYTIEYPNGSRVEMIPIDPRGEAGGNDDLTVFSELWGWKHKSHQDMWAEMTVPATRFGYAQRWIDTYAGYEGESPILEQLYDEIVVSGRTLDLPDNPECYTNANGNMFATWVTQHHLPWQTREYYQSERSNLTDEQFRRLHLNEWVTSSDAYLPIEWFDACATEDVPPLSEHDELVVGIDAGVDSDCFAIVAVSRDRRYNTPYGDTEEQPDVMIKRYARAWTPPPDRPLKFDDPDDPESPAAELRRLAKTYNVVQFTYDKWQLAHLVSELEDEGLGWFDAFSQGGEREVSDKMLYDMIRERRFRHEGGMTDLRQHILNANKKIIGERKLRIVKRDHKRKVDLAVAAAMAVKRAVDLIPK